MQMSWSGRDDELKGVVPKGSSVGQPDSLSHFAYSGHGARAERGGTRNAECRAAPDRSAVIHSLPTCVYYLCLFYL